VRNLTAALLAAGLSGCGGLPQGKGPQPIPEVAFTSFSAVKPNTTVAMTNGDSRSVSGTYVNALPNITIQTVNAPVADAGSGNTTLKLTYDGMKAVSGIAFSTPSGGATFNRGSGTTLTCTSGVCGAQNSSGLAIVLDGTTLPAGWNYQSFGVWAQVTTSTSFQSGAVSAGVMTPGSAVPTTGTAVFTGIANGFFVQYIGGVPPGTASTTTASMIANVNFASRTIGFSTTGSMQTPLNGSAPFSQPLLDMAGTWTYSAGSNSFTGSVTATGMSGTASGRFYGPAAQEIGGTFSLSGSSGVFVGGFGGKRP
jgi:hypothetical protein